MAGRGKKEKLIYVRDPLKKHSKVPEGSEDSIIERLPFTKTVADSPHSVYIIYTYYILYIMSNFSSYVLSQVTMMNSPYTNWSVSTNAKYDWHTCCSE